MSIQHGVIVQSSDSENSSDMNFERKICNSFCKRLPAGSSHGNFQPNGCKITKTGLKITPVEIYKQKISRFHGGRAFVRPILPLILTLPSGLKSPK